MAAMAADLQYNDLMSPVLKSIISSLETTINMMGQLDAVSSAGIPAESFVGLNNELEQSIALTEDFISNEQEVASEAQAAADSFGGWKGSIMAANAAIGLIKQGIGKIKDLFAGADESIKSEIQLGVVMSNQGASLEEFQSLKNAAAEFQTTNKSTYTQTAMLSGAAELATYLQSGEAIEAFLPTLADYAAGMGGAAVDARQMTEYATQLGKALDGAFDGLSKKGFSLSDEQKEIIETGSEMERVAVITDVIGQSWAGLSEEFANTPQGKVMQFNQTLDSISGSIVDVLYPAALNFIEMLETHLPEIQTLFDGLGWAIAVIINLFSAGLNVVLELFGGAMAWAAEHTDELKSALLIVGAVAAIIAAGMAIGWIMANWPLILITGAIFLLITKLEEMGVTTEQVIEFVGGLFGFLYALIYNGVAMVWNAIAGFAEFFANVFDDPLGSTVRLFTDVFDCILAIVQTAAGAIDFITGSSLSRSIEGFRNDMREWTLDNFGEAKIKVERMSYIDTGDSMESGISTVQGFMNGLDGLGDIFNSDSLLNGHISSGSLDSIGKIDNAVEISNDELKYLRDFAEQKVISKLTTNNNDPVINVHVDKIADDADFDELGSRIGKILNEQLAVSSEGEPL